MLWSLKRGTEAIHAVTAPHNRILARNLAPTNSVRSATERAARLVPRPANASDSDDPALGRDHSSEPFSESVMELVLGVLLLGGGGLLRGVGFLRPLAPTAGLRSETRNCPTLTRKSTQHDALRRDGQPGAAPYPIVSLRVGQHNSASRGDDSMARGRGIPK